MRMKANTCTLIGALAFFAAASAGAQESRPLEVFAEKGAFSLIGKSGTRVGRRLDSLKSHERIQIALGTSVVLWNRANGERFRVTGPAVVEFTGSKLVKISGNSPQALAPSEPVAAQRSPSNRATAANLRGGDIALTGFVGAARPGTVIPLRWTANEGAKDYRLTLTLNGKKLLTEKLDSTTFDLKPQPGDGWMQLTVVATYEDGNVDQVSTLVRWLSDEEAKAVGSEERAILGWEASVARSVALVGLYLDFGLVHEARSVFNALDADTKKSDEMASLRERLRVWPLGEDTASK